MRMMYRFSAALISLLLAAAPASALDIAPALDGSSWDVWADFELVALEFDDDDWAYFIDTSVAEFLLPTLDAGEIDDGSPKSLFTQVSQRH
jgi:hypothetical protein